MPPRRTPLEVTVRDLCRAMLQISLNPEDPLLALPIILMIEHRATKVHQANLVALGIRQDMRLVVALLQKMPTIEVVPAKVEHYRGSLAWLLLDRPHHLHKVSPLSNL